MVIKLHIITRVCYDLKKIIIIYVTNYTISPFQNKIFCLSCPKQSVYTMNMLREYSCEDVMSQHNMILGVYTCIKLNLI